MLDVAIFDLSILPVVDGTEVENCTAVHWIFLELDHRIAWAKSRVRIIAIQVSDS